MPNLNCVSMLKTAMAHIYNQTYFDDGIIPLSEARLSIASSAVLYGLSVYTVFPIHISDDNKLVAFRVHDHYERLINSARIIGMDTFEQNWTETKFIAAVKKVVAANNLSENTFVRATVHVDEKLAGTRSRGLKTILSIFLYEATPILPQSGARLKTSVWRRTPDNAIPSRAKVNGAYINSVLAKQDAIDSGYDDCIFLDAAGHVCELSAANIFIVRGDTLITPGTTSDLLEGINRKTVLEIADVMGIKVKERDIDLTELYIADEVFACGTSVYITPIIEIDARKVGSKNAGPITKKIRTKYLDILHGRETSYRNLTTLF
ncbi:branched-chain amino acid transaminase [soil metagenome]